MAKFDYTGKVAMIVDRRENARHSLNSVLANELGFDATPFGGKSSPTVLLDNNVNYHLLVLGELPKKGVSRFELTRSFKQISPSGKIIYLSPIERPRIFARGTQAYLPCDSKGYFDSSILDSLLRELKP